MPKLIFIFLISLALFSCGQQESTPSATTPETGTNNEKDPLQEAKRIYGGLIVFDKNKSEIIASSSPKLNSMSDIVSLPASHIAWLFYKNADEKPADSLSVVVKLSNGQNPVYSFPVQQLKKANDHIAAIEQTAAFLKKDDYAGLYGLFSPEVAAQMTQQDLGLFCNEVFEQKGKPVGFTFQGFKFFTLSGKNKELIHYAGMLHREKQDTPLSVFVDPDKGQLYSIKFDY